MKQTQIKKIFILLNLIYKKPFSILEIIEKYKSIGILISNTSIKNYIKILIDNDIDIISVKEKNKLKYHIKTAKKNFTINKSDIDILEDIKKILLYKRKYKEIRQIMHLYFLFSKYIEDEDLKDTLLDFEYYSTLNWYIVEQLNKHCKEKNIIEFEYVKTKGGIEEKTVHADMIKCNPNSGRLYLYGILNNDNHFSKVPIERILTIKKVIRKNKKLYFKSDLLICKIRKTKTNISKDNFFMYENHKDFYTIKCPIIDRFEIIQKLMQFCPNLFYISDKSIKEELINKLKTLEKFYE